ncbi:triple tyrosine motif-containing protein [Colwelliaceae bacterium MEBiC 14330]
MPKIIPITLQAKLYILITFSLLFFSQFNHANQNYSLENLSNVKTIVQDKRGFIWLSGQEGLTRLDGDSKITFSLNNQDWPLPFSWIHDIDLIDNNLLLATETHGTWLFNSQNGTIEKQTVNIPRQSHYHSIFFKDKYYINAPNKLYSYDPKTNKTLIINNNIAINNLVHTKEHLYIAGNNGLYKLENQKLSQLLNEPITAMTALSNAVIVISQNKIYRLSDDGDSLNISHNEKLNGLTKTFYGDNFITVSNSGKITKYHGLSLVTLPHHYGNSEPVHPMSVFQDASGVIWLASSHNIQQLTESKIHNHKVIFDIPINANEIALFDNEIVIGSYGAGLQNFISPVFEEGINNLFSKKGLKIFTLLEINADLYIASSDGVWRYDKSLKQLTKLDILEDTMVLQLEYHNNLLYIGTNYEGLYIYDLSTNEIIKHINIADGIVSPEVIDVLLLDRDQIWLATSSHISIYQPSTGAIKNLKSPNKSKVISLIYVDNKIFASTLGDGILVFNRQGDLLAQISKGHSFTEMLFVNDEIWVSGKPGLYRLSPRDYQITLVANTQQYTFVSSMLVKDNTLYAIHYSGVLAINLNESQQFHSNVVISKTTISGNSYLLNKTIEIDSGNDVITLDLASLDFRPGMAKKFQYRINNNQWQQISNNQLTLTGLAPGNYHLEIMATNSLGHWSTNKAYTEIHVAYPWYWTIQMRTTYGLMLLFIILFTAWLLYLRAKSISHIHTLLKNDMTSYSRMMKVIQRNLHLAAESLENDKIKEGKQLIEKSLSELNNNFTSQEPDNLEGKTLAIAIPFLANYLQSKYQVKLNFTLDDHSDDCKYEIRADIYKIIFEALTSAIFNNDAKIFHLSLQEVKQKLWLTINSDNDCFMQLESKIKFDLSSYTIRQITLKHHASLNTFDNDDGSSQLVISFPLMQLT